MLAWEQKKYNLMRFVTLLFIFFYSIVSAQETTWFDAEWNETSKENASFYRPTPAKIKKGYWVIDYYKNGTIKREGYAKNPRKKRAGFHGLVIEYYLNGNPSIKLNYRDGQLNGICKEYFKTGELKKQYRYKEGKRNGVWKEFYDSGKIKTKGKYKDDERVGVWKTYYKNSYNSFFDY